MDKKKRWADYSDSECSYDDEDRTTISETDESLDGPSLPYYVKIVNFPYKTTEVEIQEHLKLNADHLTHLKLLYSKGNKKKFRGIAILKVTSIDTGRRIRNIQLQPFGDRQLRFETLKEWIDEPKPLNNTTPATLSGQKPPPKSGNWPIARHGPTRRAKQNRLKH